MDDWTPALDKDWAFHTTPLRKGLGAGDRGRTSSPDSRPG